MFRLFFSRDPQALGTANRFSWNAEPCARFLCCGEFSFLFLRPCGSFPARRFAETPIKALALASAAGGPGQCSPPAEISSTELSELLPELQTELSRLGGDKEP
jgi:hypothetical protein